jgi:hypothetical protein
MMTRRFIPHRLWLAYYTALWCVRCYAWQPFIHRVIRSADWFFDEADIQVRKRSKLPL